MVKITQREMNKIRQEMLEDDRRDSEEEIMLRRDLDYAIEKIVDLEALERVKNNIKRLNDLGYNDIGYNDLKDLV